MAGRFLHLVRHGEALDDGDLTAAGRRQAELIGQRLAELPVVAVHHGPLPRAAQTAELVSRFLPGVPVHASEILGDHTPPATGAPEVYTGPLRDLSDDDLRTGAAYATAAIERHARPADPAVHEVVVTHNFLIGWFVRHALDAPDWRWIGLNQANCALTTILYRPARAPMLIRFNDMGHLPPELRWTGFPPELQV